MLTEGPTDAENVDRISCVNTEIWRKLMESSRERTNVDGGLLKVLRSLEKL